MLPQSRINDLDRISQVQIVQQWPPNMISVVVPTQISYSLTPNGCNQWGYDLDDGSVVNGCLRNGLETKDLKAELQALVELARSFNLTDFGFDNLIQAEGIPTHLYKTPEQMARDFLQPVAKHVYKELLTKIGRRVTENVRIDLAISYPPWWSESEKTKYYHVVDHSFTLDLFPRRRRIYFVDELRASTTLHLYYGLSSAPQDYQTGQAVLVCETTVDGAQTAFYSFDKVESGRLPPRLDFSQVCRHGKCETGESLVDKEFIRFFISQLSPRQAEALQQEIDDFTTGANQRMIVRPRLRQILDRFAPIRSQFDGNDNKFAWPIRLPRELCTEGEASGAIRITSDDLKRIFSLAMDNLENLINTQITYFEAHCNQSPKAIFVSGPFVLSPYVFKRLEKLGEERGVGIQRLEDPSTSIPKGCIAHSLGILGEPPKPVMKVCRSYGVAQVELGQDPLKSQSSIKWLVDKDDPLFPDSDSPRCESLELDHNFPQNPASHGTAPAVILVISSCEADARPLRMSSVDSRADNRLVNIGYDPAAIPASQVQKHEMRSSGRFLGKSYRNPLQASFRLDMEIGCRDVKVRLESGGVELGGLVEPVAAYP
ncbi:hypothetical protein QBC44DRAFT_381951 [Cladorrhinum sp. PSN332]|nr:hypothetical protein QBC44DRAFT_381951 [Cladorrhinum sp. PSN332]